MLTPLASTPASLDQECAETCNGGIVSVLSIRSSGHGVIECWRGLQDQGGPRHDRRSLTSWCYDETMLCRKGVIGTPSSCY